MKQTIPLAILSFSLLLGACATSPNEDVIEPATTTTVSEDIVDELPVDDTTPLGQGRPATGPFYLDSTELNIAESFPLQIFVAVEGSQPTPCDEVDWTWTQDGDRIDIDLYTVADPAATCIQALQPVSFTISLGSFETGTYTIYINEEEIGSFDA